MDGAQAPSERSVIDAALVAAKAQLDEAVAHGTVMQEQADTAYAQLQARGVDLIVGRRGGASGRHHGRESERLPPVPDTEPSARTATGA